MSPNGAVRAMVGGRNLRGTGLFNRATQALSKLDLCLSPLFMLLPLKMAFPK